MKKTDTKCFALSGLLFVLFIVFTVLVKTVDVRLWDATGTNIGFATVNTALAGKLAYNSFWYTFTEDVGYIAIGLALGFALTAGWQLIKGKSLKAVDPCLIALGVFYVVVVGFYVVFEKIEINYRPILLEAEPELSYPSSHSVLAICIFGTAIILFSRYVNEKLRLFAKLLALVLLLVTVVGRLLSGVHWFTDICGAVILSAALVTLYAGVYWKLSQNK